MKSPAQTPRPLLAAAVAEALQGLLGTVLGVAVCLAALTDDGGDVLAGVLGGISITALGVALIVVARGLFGANGWARTPSLVFQLIQIPIGFTTADDVPAVAYPLLLSAAVVLVGLFAPSSNAVLAD